MTGWLHHNKQSKNNVIAEKKERAKRLVLKWSVTAKICFKPRINPSRPWWRHHHGNNAFFFDASLCLGHFYHLVITLFINLHHVWIRRKIIGQEVRRLRRGHQSCGSDHKGRKSSWHPFCSVHCKTRQTLTLSNAFFSFVCDSYWFDLIVGKCGRILARTLYRIHAWCIEWVVQQIQVHGD